MPAPSPSHLNCAIKDPFSNQKIVKLPICQFFSFNWHDAKCPILTENTPCPFEMTWPFLPHCLFQNSGRIWLVCIQTSFGLFRAPCNAHDKMSLQLGINIGQCRVKYESSFVSKVHLRHKLLPSKWTTEARFIVANGSSGE
jgi:hypothetical protein